MATDRQLIEFLDGDPALVIEHMGIVSEQRDGWVNIEPVVDPDMDLDVEPPGALNKMFGARGPVLPFITYMPGADRRNGPKPTSLGIEHPYGPKAKNHLVSQGMTIPTEWIVKQDNPKRGLVFHLPPATAPTDVLDFALRAARTLTWLPLTDKWSAVVTRRR